MRAARASVGCTRVSVVSRVRPPPWPPSGSSANDVAISTKPGRANSETSASPSGSGTRLPPRSFHGCPAAASASARGASSSTTPNPPATNRSIRGRLAPRELRPRSVVSTRVTGSSVPFTSCSAAHTSSGEASTVIVCTSR